MEWVDRLNQTIAYIEDHLTEEIACEALARLACCSAYHYQRMFAYMAGVSLSEYIRRRRMSLAAVDLQAGEKVLDTALKYGYQSPTAFNRAFQAVHGIPPSAAREPGAAVKSFSPLCFTITIKGVEEMEYRIEKREAFRIVGVSAPLDTDLEKNFAVVPRLWGRAASDGTIPRLAEMMDGQPMGLLGVSACGGEDWRLPGISGNTPSPPPPGPFSPAREPAHPCRSWRDESLPNGSPPPGTSTAVRRISRSTSTQTRITPNTRSGFPWSRRAEKRSRAPCIGARLLLTHRYRYSSKRNIGLMQTTSSYSSCSTWTEELRAFRSAFNTSKASPQVWARPSRRIRIIRSRTMGWAYQ